MSAVLVEQEPQDRPSRWLTSGKATPSDLLRLAIEQNADLDRLEKLMDLQTRWEADQARKAYVAAMAEFKAEPLRIVKDKHVKFGNTEYDHATIGNVTTQICMALGKHGFSHRWDTTQQGGVISVSCIITHALGHSESTMLSAGADKSGAKNEIQAIASAVTYLQRYTLLAATGLATSDQEDDDAIATGERKEEAVETEADKLARKKAAHDAAFARHSESIAFIKERLADGDYAAAGKEWYAIPQDDQRALWVSTKVDGACFTTAERDAIKNKLPKEAAK